MYKFIATTKSGNKVSIVDCKESKEYFDIMDFQFIDEKNKTYLFTTVKDDKKYVIINGKESKNKYKDIKTIKPDNG